MLGRNRSGDEVTRGGSRNIEARPRVTLRQASGHKVRILLIKKADITLLSGNDNGPSGGGRHAEDVETGDGGKLRHVVFSFSDGWVSRPKRP